MIGQKLLIRLVGTLTCVAAVAAGWDAEAARWHHRRGCCCYETSCCDPCCTPVCTTACAPACERVCVTYRDPCTNCCTRSWSYRVSEPCCVAAAPTCCEAAAVAATEQPAAAPASPSVVKTAADKR